MENKPAQGPSEEKLKLLIKNGGDCIEVAQDLIDKHKLPFIIVKDAAGVPMLRSSYSDGELWLQKFITIDGETMRMKADAARMSTTSYEVLIQGETGTGKEIIAKSQIGNRPGPIKSVNCAGLPRELIESELFGYTQGAFTGASKTTDGLITSAANGVMFLDEIGEMPLDVQAKLLRVLQDKAVRKVGGRVEEKVNCKFVFATNRDLRKMVENGTFRQDLYARISTLELDIEPLRHRKCDIIPIIKSMGADGDKFIADYGEDKIREMDVSMNVRSLQQYVIRYAVLGRISADR